MEPIRTAEMQSSVDRSSNQDIPGYAGYRLQSGDEATAGVGGANRTNQRCRPDHRRKWFWQGTDRARHPSLFIALLQALGGCQLRGVTVAFGGERAVRLRERRL